MSRAKKVRVIENAQPGLPREKPRPVLAKPSYPATRSGSAVLVDLTDDRARLLSSGDYLARLGTFSCPPEAVLVVSVRGGIDRRVEKAASVSEVPVLEVMIGDRALAMSPSILCEVIDDNAARPAGTHAVSVDAYGESTRPTLWIGDAERGKTTQRELRGES